MKRLLIVCMLLLTTVVNDINAQQTVGLFMNTPKAYNGYTLFTPLSGKGTYLIDNCGELIHEWTSATNVGMSAYLLENGILLRGKDMNNNIFTAGGSAGGMELLDWNSNVLWDYTISSATECHHHDIEPLPNGNILAIVWHAKTPAEANAAGRTTVGASLWAEKIVEIKPNMTNGGGTVVWEWDVWDHLVQDVDNGKSNFGNVSQSPELVNINYVSGSATNSDWLHINSVDYNAQLDQIVLSVHSFSEIWVIDHSTTTAEAASHSGGNSGKGGDLLYRWGNPQAYNQGTAGNQVFYKQHDARWIENGYVDSGMIMVFNNQAGTPQNSSAINVINTPVDASGKYSYIGGAYAPVAPHWTYQAPNPRDFYAANISGAHRLPNGNTLICSGPTGEFFEVDYSGNMGWKYISPVGRTGIATQGSIPNQNNVFRCARYSVDYAGLAGHTLTPQGYIESGSTFSCDLYPTDIKAHNPFKEVTIFPNPTVDRVQIAAPEIITGVVIYNTLGQLITKHEFYDEKLVLSLPTLNSGVYFVQVQTADGQYAIRKLQIIK